MLWSAKFKFRSRQTERDRTLVLLQPDPGQREDLLVVLGRDGEPKLRVTADGLFLFTGPTLFWDYEQDAYVSTPPSNAFARWEQTS